MDRSPHPSLAQDFIDTETRYAAHNYRPGWTINEGHREERAR